MSIDACAAAVSNVFDEMSGCIMTRADPGFPTDGGSTWSERGVIGARGEALNPIAWAPILPSWGKRGRDGNCHFREVPSIFQGAP